MWYRSVKSSITDWDSLITKLKKDFLHDDIDEDLWEQIKRRKQRKNETTVVFIAHLETLFARLSRPPAEISKVKHIRKNIFPEFISRLALVDINTVSELSELCRKLEESDYMKDKNKPRDEVAGIDIASTSSKKFENLNTNQNRNSNVRKDFNKNHRNFSKPSNVSQNKRSDNNQLNQNKSFDKNKSKTSVVCWNCELPNHTYLNCKGPRNIFCFKCGEGNVKTSTCPKCSKN